MKTAKKKLVSNPDLADTTSLPLAVSATIAPPAVMSAAASYAGVTIKPPMYDPAVAEAYLTAYRARLDAIPAAEIVIPRVDVRAAALAALGVYTFVAQVEPLRARFEEQHGIGAFDLANVEGLKAASFLVFYAHAQAEAAGAFASDAKVPASLVQKGLEVEARMQELCEYQFKRDPEIAPILAILRPGTGHRDLAGDLMGYADIYAARPEKVATDANNYRPTDLAEARRIGGEILSHLAAAMSPKAREAYDLLQRAWTLLVQIYTEVQETGRWLQRRDPRRDEWFPSLYAAGKAGRPKKKASGAADKAKGDEVTKKENGAAAGAGAKPKGDEAKAPVG